MQIEAKIILLCLSDGNEKGANMNNRTIFIWETGESGDINVCRNKTLNCYPNYVNGLYSENTLSNTKPNN